MPVQTADGFQPLLWTSTEATLASWFGVSDANLPSIFPNLVNFSTSNLGFMS